MNHFDESYWDRQRARLDVSDEVRHVHFAKFVADHCAHRLKHVEHVGWYRWNGRVWEATGDSGAAMQAITGTVVIDTGGSITNADPLSDAILEVEAEGANLNGLCRFSGDCSAARHAEERDRV